MINFTYLFTILGLSTAFSFMDTVPFIGNPSYFRKLIHRTFLSFMTKGHCQELGVATLSVSDEEEKKVSQYVPGPGHCVCDLDVIQNL